MASDEKKKALDAAIAKLEKDFGKGTVMKLGEGSHVAVETDSYRVSESRSGTGTWRCSKGTCD